MTRKKHKKNSTIFDDKLRLPESYNNLSLGDSCKTIIIELSKVLKPLYSVIPGCGEGNLETLAKPLDFVEAQMSRIIKFLTINADYYLDLTGLNYEDYFERIKRVVNITHGDIQVGLAFDENYVTDESDMAFIMVMTFFDELDKLFVIKTNDIVCHTNEVINNIDRIVNSAEG